MPSVIMLTGQGDKTIAVQAIKGGAQDDLVKGKLTCDSLRQAVHGVIKQMQLGTLAIVNRPNSSRHLVKLNIRYPQPLF
jgi:FixJ family two-component response regulator